MRTHIAQLLPHLVLAALALGFVQLDAITGLWRTLAQPAMITVAILSAVLALRFFRPAILLGALTLVLASLALDELPALLAEAEVDPHTLGRLLPLALPPTFALFALLPERGLRSLPGVVRLLWLPLLALLLLSLSRPPWNEKIAPVSEALLSAYLPLHSLDLLGVGEPALLLLLVSLPLLLIPWIRQADALRIAWISSLLLGMAALSSEVPEEARPWLFALAGAALLTGLFEHAHALAYRDLLTGLPGRRALMEELQRVAGTWTIAVLDIDHFKNFNDTWGHDLGDVVLQRVARALQLVGGGGRAYRLGGEEFTIVFRGRSADQAEPHLEALRKDIAAIEIDTSAEAGAGGKRRSRKKKVCVTASIGAAESNAELRSPAALLKRADQALYKAKSEGRNRVHIERMKGRKAA